MKMSKIIITRDAREKRGRHEIAIWSSGALPILKHGLFEDDIDKAWNILDFDENAEEPIVVDSLSCKQFQALFGFLPKKGSITTYQLVKVKSK